MAQLDLGLRKLWTNRMKRNIDFLKSILREKNANLRKEKILHASKDQINSVSELVMNMLKRRIALPPQTLAKLRKYSGALREVGRRVNSLKKRRQLLAS